SPRSPKELSVEWAQGAPAAVAVDARQTATAPPSGPLEYSLNRPLTRLGASICLRRRLYGRAADLAGGGRVRKANRRPSSTEFPDGETTRVDHRPGEEERMRRLVSLFAAGAVCALALAALSLGAAQTTVWTAALSSGQEVPKQVVKDAAAHGLFKGTLSGHTLKWKLTFAKLTGPAMQAHIHKGAKGV